MAMNRAKLTTPTSHAPHIRRIDTLAHRGRDFGLVAAVAVFWAGFWAGCVLPRPSQDECNEFVDHVIELTKKAGHSAAKAEKLDEENARDDLVNECTMRGTRAEVECALKQTSFDDIASHCK